MIVFYRKFFFGSFFLIIVFFLCNAETAIAKSRGLQYTKKSSRNSVHCFYENIHVHGFQNRAQNRNSKWL